MPFLDNQNRESCLAETADAIVMIESIVNDFPYHDFVIGGDLNTELNGSSPFDPLWKEFTDSHRFAYCSQMFAGPRFTYHHESLGQTKFNDHFIVSESILMDNHKILEDGHNPSDHLPITMMVFFFLKPRQYGTRGQKRKKAYVYRPIDRPTDKAGRRVASTQLIKKTEKPQKRPSVGPSRSCFKGFLSRFHVKKKLFVCLSVWLFLEVTTHAT